MFPRPQCLDRQKVQAVAPEDAVEDAAELATTNNLWALVTFDVAGNDTLEPFVKYRIRFGILPLSVRALDQVW